MTVQPWIPTITPPWAPSPAPYRPGDYRAWWLDGIPANPVCVPTITISNHTRPEGR